MGPPTSNRRPPLCGPLPGSGTREHAPGRGPALGTWRSEVSSQKASDPRFVTSQDVGRAVRPDRAS
eukprot:6912456-Prymnesium_polylepis.1